MKTHQILIAIEFIGAAAELFRHEANYYSAIHLAAAERITRNVCRIINEPSYSDDVRAFVIHALSSTNTPYPSKEINSAYYEIKMGSSIWITNQTLS